MKKWIALFSHTGREIAEVSRRLGIKPHRIVTNKPVDDDTIWEELDGITFVARSPVVDDYEAFLEPDALITMHGWMRIVPPEICDKYELLNLHPGLITRYPELKGKDPQQQVFNMLNPPSRVGCVIHRATSELDSGEVLMERSIANTFYSAPQLTTYLHRMAWDMWEDFLNIYMCLDEQQDDEMV